MKDAEIMTDPDEEPWERPLSILAEMIKILMNTEQSEGQFFYIYS